MTTKAVTGVLKLPQVEGDSDRGKLSAGHYYMMVGDPKNVYGNPIDLHPNCTLNFRMNFGCKYIGFQNTFLGSPIII